MAVTPVSQRTSGGMMALLLMDTSFAPEDFDE